jgi:hypothetical protein
MKIIELNMKMMRMVKILELNMKMMRMMMTINDEEDKGDD